jgi:hypothetical protein
MDFTDTLTLDAATRRTTEGFLVANVRAARTGIQQYSGREVDPDNKHGLRDKAVVNVYRDEADVFSADSLRSFSVLDVTLNHPPESLTADNWKKYSVGTTGEEVVRDGEFIRIPMMLKDAAAIRAVEGGKRELSVGYSTQLVFGQGLTADGLTFDAKQTNIRANHISIVDMARGGPELKIGDSKVTTKTMLVDGLAVEVTDAAELAIKKLQDAQAKLVADHAAADAKAATESAAKDAKIATLDAELATAKAAILTGDALDKAVAARAQLISDAKALIGDKADVTGTDADIKKRVVLAKLGDAYKDREAVFFDAAFEMQVVGKAKSPVDPLRAAINDGKNTPTMERALIDARAARDKRYAEAHAGKAA